MTVALQLTTTREERLLREFRAAIGATSAGDLKAWGSRTVSILGEVTIRRGRNFGSLVGWIWDFLTQETEGLLKAIRPSTCRRNFGSPRQLTSTRTAGGLAVRLYLRSWLWARPGCLAIACCS